MRIDRGSVAAVAASGVLVLVLGSAGREDAGARLTRPTMVDLDFRDAALSEVVKAIETRTSKRVVVQDDAFTKGFLGGFRGGMPAGPGLRAQKVTLESPRPVAFWDAIDRLARAGRLVYRVGDFGDTGAATSGVVFHKSGDGPGPASYSGPFRVGVRGVHEHSDVLLVKGAWVRFYPSKAAAPATAADLASWPKDGGPLYVELDVAGEPGLICRRDGPLKGLEAVDEGGTSMLAPAGESAYESFQSFAGARERFRPVLRVPLVRRGQGRRLKTLRGVIPVEVGVLKVEPTVTIRCGGSEGKTFRGGGIELTVVTDRTEPDGTFAFEVSCRPTVDESPALRSARQATLSACQGRVVDARGAPARSSSGGFGGDSRGNVKFSYKFAPDRPGSPLPPVAFLLHDLDRATFDVAFEFHDIPLP